jgi:TusA-related sulfurtransferase
MRPVHREELVDYQTYEDMRSSLRPEAMAAKAVRRIHVGEFLTFLFENPLTIRYQIQEMMRTERIVRERDIQHELETYNAVLGGPGELGCTLLIEIDDPAERALRLGEWYVLPAHLYARADDGTLVRPTFDEEQRGDGRLSSVQYLKFDVRGRTPLAIGVDMPGLRAEATLDAEQRAALAADLAGE